MEQQTRKNGTAAPAAPSGPSALSAPLYSLRQWELPLPASLCARLALQLGERPAPKRQGCDCEGDGSVERGTEVDGDDGTHASDGAQTPLYSLRFDLSLLLAPTAGEAFLPLCELQRVTHFVLTYFPFEGMEAMLDALLRVATLWPRCGRQAETDAQRAQATPSLSLPIVQSASIRAQLLLRPSPSPSSSATPRVVADLSRTLSAPSAQFLGRDVNAWGDVDVLLEQAREGEEDAAPQGSQGQDTPSDGSAAPRRMSCRGSCATPPTSSASSSSVATPSTASSAPSAGLYCLNLQPGHSIPLHVHYRMHEVELVLGRSLRAQFEPAAYGAVHRWRRRPHLYENRSETLQRIFCINVPRFDPTDEVVVPHDEHNLSCLTSANCPLAQEGRCDTHRPEETFPPFPSRTPLQLWRELLDSQDRLRSDEQGLSWTFPGGFGQGQTVELRVDGPAAKVGKEHAVLLFLFREAERSPPRSADPTPSPSSTPDAEPSPHPDPQLQLLLVRHRARGWELPGGKVDAGDQGALAAVRRELQEESGVVLPSDAFVQRVAQYTLREPGQIPHVKSVYAALLQRDPAEPASEDERLEWKHETSGARWMGPPPDWEAVHATEPATGGSDGGATNGADSDGHDADSTRFSPLLQDNVYPLCLQLAMAAVCNHRQQSAGSKS